MKIKIITLDGQGTFVEFETNDCKVVEEIRKHMKNPNFTHVFEDESGVKTIISSQVLHNSLIQVTP